MKRSTMRPAALALAGILSFGLAACDDDADTGAEIGEELNEDDFGTGDLDDGDVGGEDDGSN